MSVPVALAIAAALVVLAVVAGLVLRTRDGRRRGGGGLRVRPADLAPAALAPRATLVQFSTELCTRCPQVRRLLGQVATAHDGVSHVEVDLTHRTDLGTRYHVLQTPTTFLVDSSGAVLSRWGGIPDRRTVDDALSTVLAPHPQEYR